METSLHDYSVTRTRVPYAALARGLGWGLMGGLVGTLIMDLLLMGALSAVGLPALTCFSIVGNTVSRLFSILGIEMGGDVSAGVATHYLVGPVIGAVFGAVLAKMDALRAGTLKKCVLLAVLYVEILSQPLLAMTPILLKMNAADTLMWSAGSFVMHFIWGIALGVIVHRGLRLVNVVNRN